MAGFIRQTLWRCKLTVRVTSSNSKWPDLTKHQCPGWGYCPKKDTGVLVGKLRQSPPTVCEAQPKGKLWVCGYAGALGTLDTRLQDSPPPLSVGVRGLVSTPAGKWGHVQGKL